MSKDKIRVGIIGCGKISSRYFEHCKVFDILEVTACSDIRMDRAKAQAEAFGVPTACTVEELLSDPDIRIAVNLTIPEAHAEVTLAALEAGKDVYTEKPLAATREDARKILETAAANGLRVGCAPDTFLGGGLQTCRKLIDEGAIGEPIAASAFMTNHGAEHWHPDPSFLYQPGAGPMLDVGVYYVTALVNLIGPVKRVAGSARITFTERTITSQPNYGKKIKVNTPTHITGVMEFANGALCTVITSFDMWGNELPRIEIYGAGGTLSVPDPNTFGGPVRIFRGGADGWADVPLTHGYTDAFRGLGVADLAYALRSGRPHRANGDMAYHVLDVMLAFLDASRDRKHIELSSTATRPAPFPVGLQEGKLDG